MCDQLGNEIESLQEILSNFTKGKENFDMMLLNQRASYNKVGIGHQTNNNPKYFISICHAKKY